MTKQTAGAAALDSAKDVLAGQQPGFALVRGKPEGSAETFIVVSVRGMPRLMLPPNGPALRTGLSSFLGARPWVGPCSAVLPVAAKLGRSDSATLRHLSLQSSTGARSPMRELLSSVIDRDDYFLALRLSFGRPNAKTVAVAVSTTGEVLCFAKFGSEAMTNDLITHESAAINRFADQDLPVALPQSLYSGSWTGNCSVLVTKPLQLGPLSQQANEAHRAADAFTAANGLESSTLRQSAFWHRMNMRFKALCEADGNSSDALELLTRIESTWGEHPFDFGVSHGDWSRANVGLSGDRVAAIDWERFSESAPRGIDAAHFAIIDNSNGPPSKTLDIARLAEQTQQHMNAADRDPSDAKPLVLLALLELVARFMEAKRAGLRTKDSKFEKALQAGLREWSQ